ncbi:hypothetical protein [Amaricoccus sp.]|uniref:hypothetical protein n=1 Tax=Amaricoccus sp. TaxID=1872485 RepID=UPI001B4F3C52|nr:hypothetical protein [Amaricoccus sp.]MBP7001046.1 hypothetical protein [Amaricoccus sp.]
MRRDLVTADISRRWLLRAAPLIGVASAVPLDAQPATIDQKIVDLIADLERVDGWEMGSTICAKLWVASELRAIAGMEASPFGEEIDQYHATRAEYLANAQRRNGESQA